MLLSSYVMPYLSIGSPISQLSFCVGMISGHFGEFEHAFNTSLTQSNGPVMNLLFVLSYKLLIKMPPNTPFLKSLSKQMSKPL